MDGMMPIFQAENCKITLAKKENIRQMVYLEKVNFSGDLISTSEYQRLLTRPKTVKVYCVYYDDRLIASAVLITKRLKKKARLYSLAVHPEFQSLGIGNALLTVMEDECARMKLVSLYLEVSASNPIAYQVYAHRGYFTIGKYEKFYSDGSNAIRMQKIIPEFLMFQETKLTKVLRSQCAI